MASELTIGGLDEWADNLEAAYDLTVEEQARITLAGAKVLEKNMKSYIKDQHYQNRKTGEDPHLADSVKSQGKNVDGAIDGTSVVGFPDEKAYIANFISGGTKHVIYDSSKFHGKSARTDSKGNDYIRGGRRAVTGDDFLDKVRNASLPEIFEAEDTEYHKILKGKGVDI